MDGWMDGWNHRTTTATEMSIIVGEKKYTYNPLCRAVKMADGRWPMTYGQWPMANCQWPMAEGQWPMINRQ